jgi:hypothetical protein
MNKPLVIIESPYAGDMVRNTRYAKLCMKDSFDRGEVPFVSHLLYTMVLDDTILSDRRLGMEAGFELVRRSDYSAVYTDYGISDGMKEGIKIAEELGHKIEYRRLEKDQIQ